MTDLPALAPALAALRGYPHLARCGPCQEYLRDHLPDLGGGLGALVAVLAFHDGCHLRDPRTAGADHFASV